MLSGLMHARVKMSFCAIHGFFMSFYCSVLILLWRLFVFCCSVLIVILMWRLLVLNSIKSTSFLHTDSVYLYIVSGVSLTPDLYWHPFVQACFVQSVLYYSKNETILIWIFYIALTSTVQFNCYVRSFCYKKRSPTFYLKLIVWMNGWIKLIVWMTQGLHICYAFDRSTWNCYICKIQLCT